MTLQELQTAANTLQARDKAVLAYSLLSSLEAETDTDTTALWVAESEQRFERYKEHKQSVAASDFLQQMALELDS